MFERTGSKIQRAATVLTTISGVISIILGIVVYVLVDGRLGSIEY